ncbi:MATE family efflux transporter [Treponema sp.]|uniref:MATE family efflux transporter n=1 Tax=Treponema sp. TaxID=166 RepID=UPI00298E6549|nr:MATE family efflux transporter [Treponema sp.]MCQ2241680.1 MATE family efflux transporter [Treponema sp.]
MKKDNESTNESPKENILGTERIGKLLAKFAIPGIISMVVNSFYNIVDQIFIGRGVGYLGNGATSVIFPVVTFAMAFSLLFGDGAAAFLSLKLGEKKEEEAAKGTMAGIIGFLTIGLFLAILYMIFMKPLCRIFGASDGILPYAVEYGRIITIGLPFCAICSGGSSIIRADGNPRFNMIGLFTGTIINVVLDPIFIFIFHWGVKGAALATILGQAANGILNIYYFTRKMKSVKLHRFLWKKSLSYIPVVSKLGVSSFISQMALVIAIAARNNVLVAYGLKSKYGPDIPVTTLGITMKTFSIIMSIVIGLSAGAQPIFGYNYGSGKYDRVKRMFKLVAVISTIICTCAFLVAQLKPMAIISIFGSENDIYNEFAIKCMRIYLMLIPTLGIQIMSGIFFQALGYPMQASILSLSKQIVFQLPFTFILPIFLGVEGVLWTGPVSDTLSFLTTIIMLLIYWKKMFSRPALV